MNIVFEALAHPTRRAILEMLKSGSRTAGEIAEAFDVSKPTMSGHFAKLKEAGLIHADQHGTSIVYSINMSVLEEAVMGFMGRFGTRSASRESSLRTQRSNPEQAPVQAGSLRRSTPRNDERG